MHHQPPIRSVVAVVVLLVGAKSTATGDALAPTLQAQQNLLLQHCACRKTSEQVAHHRQPRGQGAPTDVGFSIRVVLVRVPTCRALVDRMQHGESKVHRCDIHALRCGLRCMVGHLDNHNG